MPGVTGGDRRYHRGSPGGFATANQCLAGTAWYPFTRIPPGGGDFAVCRTFQLILCVNQGCTEEPSTSLQ